MGIPGENSTDGGPPMEQPPASSDAGVDGGPPFGPPASPDAGAADAGAAASAYIPLAIADGGSVAFDLALLPEPPQPSLDDPAACGSPMGSPPDISPVADRPCTIEEPGRTTTFRYDSTGRIVFRSVQTDAGAEETYTLEEDGGTRVETVTENGRVTSRDVTRLNEGNPEEAQHFDAAAGGGLVLQGHSIWLYDAQGRLKYVTSQRSWNEAPTVERYVYDPQGRPYFVDRAFAWPGATIIAGHDYTSRSWYANGIQAHEIETCDLSGGAPCGTFEERWTACGNLAFSGHQTGLGRGSSFTDWSWDADGRLLTRHVSFNSTGPFYNTTESYHLDEAGRAVSGTMVTTPPAEYTWLSVERHDTSYRYDDAGHLIEASRDGVVYFHARFDDAGRVVERGIDPYTIRWTYDGCGR